MLEIESLGRQIEKIRVDARGIKEGATPEGYG